MAILETGTVTMDEIFCPICFGGQTLYHALGVCLRKNVLNDNRLQQSLIFRFWPHWSLSIEKEISK